MRRAFIEDNWDADAGRILIDGRIPVNPHGGGLSEGGTQGSGHTREAIHQLQGLADDRQVPGASKALDHRGRVLLQRARLHLADRLTAPGSPRSSAREYPASSFSRRMPEREYTRGSVRRCGRRSAACTATGGRCRSRCPTSASGRRPSTTRNAPPREYWDEEYAATTPAGGIVAPEEFNPFAWMTAAGPPATESLGQGASTTERRLGVDPPATSQHAERRHGGRVHGRPDATRRRDPRRHLLSDYSEREGRLGLMLFTTTEQRWTNQDDELIKIQRDVLIRY